MDARTRCPTTRSSSSASAEPGRRRIRADARRPSVESPHDRRGRHALQPLTEGARLRGWWPDRCGKTSSCGTARRCGCGRRRRTTRRRWSSSSSGSRPTRGTCASRARCASTHISRCRFCEQRRRGRALARRRARRPGRRHADRRARDVSSGCATRRAPRSPSSSRTTCSGGASGAGCSSVSRCTRAASASSASSRRCCPRTRAMLRVFGDTGFEVQRRYVDGVVEVEFELTASADVLERTDRPRSLGRRRVAGASSARVRSP